MASPIGAGSAFAQSPAMGSSGAGAIAADVLQPAPAFSDPRDADTALEQARRLHGEGRPDDALAAIELALQASPSDARLRFLKGVILSEQGRGEQAIEVFRELTQDFPELPEPHNNLAALHAARGELDLARGALDDAVRALPSYALAHENLGDLNLRLAMRAWQRAAQLDPANAEVRAKLARLEALTDPAASSPAASSGSSGAMPPASRKGAPASSQNAPSPSSRSAAPLPARSTAPAPNPSKTRPVAPTTPALPGAR